MWPPNAVVCSVPILVASQNDLTLPVMLEFWNGGKGFGLKLLTTNVVLHKLDISLLLHRFFQAVNGLC